MHKVLSSHPIAIILLMICVIILAIFFCRFICSHTKKQIIKMDRKPKINIEEVKEIV